MKRFMQLLATKLGEVDTISARFDKIDLQLEKITRDEQFFKSYDDRLDSLRRAIIYHCESESADGLKAVDLRSRELIVCQALTKTQYLLWDLRDQVRQLLLKLLILLPIYFNV